MVRTHLGAFLKIKKVIVISEESKKITIEFIKKHHEEKKSASSKSGGSYSGSRSSVEIKLTEDFANIGEIIISSTGLTRVIKTLMGVALIQLNKKE